MIRIALCDDNKSYLELVESKVQRYCRDHAIAIELKIFDDSDLLADLIERGYIFDAYILDIEMQDYSGVDLAKAIQKKSDSVHIIFLTAHIQYAPYACGRGIFRYIMKDTMDTELPRVLNKLFETLEREHNDQCYVIYNQRRYLKLLHKDIIYIRREQKNVRFELKNGYSASERTTLEQVFDKLSTNVNFYQLDRGIILNLYHVQSIASGKVKVSDGIEITSSAKHIEELKRHIHGYWGSIL